MSSANLQIMRSRRFLPLFITQFLGALNDNIFKNALVILVIFRIAGERGVNGQLMATVAAGIFILPFFLFSATAGRFADKFEKSRLIVIIKSAEIAIMALAAVGFDQHNLATLMTVLFLMGTHSTFFGPLKYGILPTHLKTSELLAGNALIEAGTFLAILLGTIAGGVFILADHGIAAVSALVLAVALLGLLASLFIPRASAEAPNLKLGFNIAAHTWEMTRYAAGQRDLFLAILGISWFWLIGSVFLSQFPTFAKDVLGANEQVVTLFLTALTLLTLPILSLADGFIVVHSTSPVPVPRGHFSFAPLEVTYHRVNVEINDQVAVTHVRADPFRIVRRPELVDGSAAAAFAVATGAARILHEDRAGAGQRCPFGCAVRR